MLKKLACAVRPWPVSPKGYITVTTSNTAADSAYGKVHASIYDNLFQDRDDLDQVSKVLAAHVSNGAALEFGIGTGRVALPLAARGVCVAGVDNSQEMLGKLKEKPGAKDIRATLGSFTEARVEGEFSLVFCVFATMYLVTDQAEQVKVFANAARHLGKGGKFIVEGFVHDRRRFLHDQEVVTNRVGEDVVELRAARLNASTQTISTSRIVLTPNGIQMYPNKLRFIHPSEMDLMAQLHGFALRERWSDWNGSAFNSDSANQIAVYEKVIA